MTTSEPRTPQEHRRVGQRILDAVLGDPADTRRDDPADTRRGDPDRVDARAGERAEGVAGAGPRRGYSSSEQALREDADRGVVQDRTAAQGYLTPTRDAGDMPTDALRDVGQVGHTDRTDAVRDAGYDAGDTRSDARRDAGQAGYVDQRAAGQADTAEAPWDAGDDQPGSAVDDTATVDSSETGRSSAEAAGSGDGRGDAGVADEDGSGTRERLVPDERAEDYGSRWDALKGDFVDEPRRAVRQADELVGELLDELQRLFADQRRNLEQGFDHDQASTEDLRLALRRYRSFFDRLLSF